jgi:hypothetical protein
LPAPPEEYDCFVRLEEPSRRILVEIVTPSAPAAEEPAGGSEPQPEPQPEPLPEPQPQA